ncbi:MAG: ABC transporter permease [Acidimicrobiia bacterium]|nr:ABC transporter permease [bacterium]MXX63873.1 ABC transporter permease [Acidimicrobiia bacterium]MCY3651979.1 ABC transporter permease [bacterium]MDE0644210.1 ABC transporter permease [bacterium]MXZ07059.1 ABC transporter permease [Acidimicrobiia bacterium]
MTRTLYLVLIVAVSSVAVFYAIRLSGGDAVAAVIQPGTASLEAREQLRELWGLNLPIHEQYFAYMGRLLRGDLGNSLTNNWPISEMLIIHGRHSLLLGGAALLLVFGLGVPLGILASLRRNGFTDVSITTLSVGGLAVPNFWLALLMVWLFASTLRWLPSAGCCSPKQLVLPAVVLAMEGLALTVRMTRSAMLENLDRDFVRTLRAGGLSELRVVGRHVLRNALVPIVSLAGLRIGQIVGYALVVETIFGWPGLGQVLVNAVLRRDYAVAQFFSLVLVTLVIVGNWAADLGYLVANPRLRNARSRAV